MPGGFAISRAGAQFGSAALLACLVLLAVANFIHVPLWAITLGFAVLMLAANVCLHKLRPWAAGLGEAPPRLRETLPRADGLPHLGGAAPGLARDAASEARLEIGSEPQSDASQRQAADAGSRRDSLLAIGGMTGHSAGVTEVQLSQVMHRGHHAPDPRGTAGRLGAPQAQGGRLVSTADRQTLGATVPEAIEGPGLKRQSSGQMRLRLSTSLDGRGKMEVRAKGVFLSFFLF
jgi:hypothetical protein